MDSDNKLKKKLSPTEYHVLRQCGTETPFSGALLHEERSGEFKCKACGNKLFESGTKFDSKSGWPSFYDAVPKSVKFKQDSAYGTNRTEVTCSKCGSHLGHVFDDGPNPTGKRYCINSVALDFAEVRK